MDRCTADVFGILDHVPNVHLGWCLWFISSVFVFLPAAAPSDCTRAMVDMAHGSTTCLCASPLSQNPQVPHGHNAKPQATLKSLLWLLSACKKKRCRAPWQTKASYTVATNREAALWHKKKSAGRWQQNELELGGG